MANHQQLYLQFTTALNTFNREDALKIAMDALETKSIAIPALYESVLAKSLKAIS